MPKTIAVYKASDDSKVRQFKGHLNSTGHTAKAGCPEYTVGEGGCCNEEDPECYVYDTLKYPAVGPKLDANLKALKKCVTVDDFIAIIYDLVLHSFGQYERRVRKLVGIRRKRERKELRRLKQRGHIFRHHWSGDVLSVEHAKAIKAIADMFGDTSFWIYTRTWWAAGHLRGADNLSVFLSTDPVNIEQMLVTQAAMPELKLAHMVDNKDLKDTTATDCPATTGKMLSDGACNICGVCYESNVDVNFHINHVRRSHADLL
jgi:hypothetical protein